MIIEIRGTGTYNKGAELMAHAILEHFRQKDDSNSTKFVVTRRFGTYQERTNLGMYTKLPTSRFDRSKFIKFLISSSRLVHGFVREEEIDIIIDASGFAYSDQWGPGPAERLVKQIQARQRRGSNKLILLPQAFGPFTSDRTQSAFKEIQESADLIFAREEESYNYIKSLDGCLNNLRIAPDFTNMVQGIVPQTWKSNSSCVLIIPNTRMLDKTDPQNSQNYLKFLCNCINETIKRGLQPTLLLHSPEDNCFVQLLREQQATLNVVYESNPLNIKGIIGTAYFVIGSRFHALVNAFSQGVPAIGTGWSHKYTYLFQEYGCPHLLLPVQASPVTISNTFDSLTEGQSRLKLVEQIFKNGKELKQAVHAMWREVDSVIYS